MPTSRSYGDACGIARALDVVGERWALLVVRELLLGPERFSDLRRALSGRARTWSPTGSASSKAVECSAAAGSRPRPVPGCTS